MNRGRLSSGFTIVEVLIFLATSAVIFVGMIGLINGRQSKTEFINSGRDFETIIQDVANDVTTGYFPDAQKISCVPSGAGISITADSTKNQGTNQGCIFIGKTMTFSTNTYTLDTLAGRRLKAGGSQQPVENFDESGIKIVPELSSSNNIGRSISFGCIFFLNSPATPIATPPCSTPAAKTNKITFMTTFVANGFLPASSRFISSSIVVKSDTTTSVESYTTSTTSSNPAGGIYICLNSEASDQHALLKIGGQNANSTTSTTINGGKCS